MLRKPLILFCFFVLVLTACVEEIDTAVSPTPVPAPATALPATSENVSLAAAAATKPIATTSAPEATASPQPTRQPTTQPTAVPPTPWPLLASCLDDTPTSTLPPPTPPGLLRVLFPNNGLWLWRQETGTVEPLSSGGNITAYQLLPEYKAVVFIQAGDLWLWREETGTADRLSSSSVDQFLVSRDGAVIAFSRVLANDQYELWAVNSDGSQLRLLSTMSAADTWARNPEALAMNLWLHWPSNAHILAVRFSPLLPSSAPHASEPYFLVNTDTGVVLSPFRNYRLSPDGQQIAVHMFDTGDLHLINVADGSSRLVPPPAHSFSTFSPGGRYFIANAEAGDVIVDTADLSQRPLAHHTSPSHIWINETTWFTFTGLPDISQGAAATEPVTLWHVDIAEGLATPVGSFSGSAASIVISPDGRYIIMPDVDEMILVDTADLSQRRLPIPFIGGQGIVPELGVFGTTIYMLVPGEVGQSTSTLWRVNAATGTAAVVSAFSVAGLAFSPDGHYLALVEEADNDSRSLRLIEIATGQEVTYENGRIDLTFERWQNDSTHFVYYYQNASQTSIQYQLGQVCQSPVPIDTPVSAATALEGWLRWVDESNFLFVTGEHLLGHRQETGTLYLQSLDGQSELIGEFVQPSGIFGSPVHFYFWEPSGTCRNDAAFVLDVNLPDGTHIASGDPFTKTWRLRNSGTCTWDASYQLQFISGERMAGPERMALGETVPPGGEIDLSINLTAPQAQGTYRGQWQLAAPDGTLFGAKPYLEIVVP